MVSGSYMSCVSNSSDWKIEGSHIQTNTGKLQVMTMMIVSVHFTALVIDFCCAGRSCSVHGCGIWNIDF